MASSSSAVFSGQSSFSADFQQVLTRAVSIASLPIQTMQNAVSTLTGEQQALGSLQATFSTLHASITAIGASVSGSVTASSSQPSAVVPTTTAGALPGTYSIEVDSIGSSTTTLSNGAGEVVSDPTTTNISSASSFTLTVDGSSQTITPTGGSLESLASAINTSGAGVQATIVNLGSTASPDYRLALTSSKLGPESIQLNDGTNDLLDTLSTGTYSSYKVNGSSTVLHGTSNEVTLSPGLTVNLLQETTSGSPASISVATSYSSLGSALSNLASAYNSAVDALAQNRGQTGGALTGQSIIYSLTDVLRGISQYSGSSGTVQSMTDLGLSIDSSGHLNFDSSALSSANISSVQEFLGSTTAGGFLQSANDALTAMDDSSTGVLQSDITTVQNQITNQTTLITQAQSRVDDLQTSLQAQLSAADAAIAGLESQKNYFTSLFQATYNNNGQNG